MAHAGGSSRSHGSRYTEEEKERWLRLAGTLEDREEGPSVSERQFVNLAGTPSRALEPRLA